MIKEVIKALIVGFGVGALCRICKVSPPAPTFVGWVAIAGIILGYWLVGK